ncbi:MAG: hypothetical protein HKN17_05185 [Rhodothermales bacterium]|nr:hypothetical protein [Rhodothermales bacterium]
MPESEHRDVEFDRLNPVGKVIYVTGSVVRTASDFLEFTLRTAGTLLTEAEKAFREGIAEDEEDISDARVLSETSERD